MALLPYNRLVSKGLAVDKHSSLLFRRRKSFFASKLGWMRLDGQTRPLHHYVAFKQPFYLSLHSNFFSLAFFLISFLYSSLFVLFTLPFFLLLSRSLHFFCLFFLFFIFPTSSCLSLYSTNSLATTFIFFFLLYSISQFLSLFLFSFVICFCQ